MKLTIKSVLRDQIDHEKWDACVASTQSPQPYGFSWYLDRVSPDWKGLIYGDYEAILPIFPAKKWSFSYTSRPYGTQSTGPYSKIPLDHELLRAFIQSAMQEVRYAEFFIAPGVKAPEDLPVVHYSNFILDLSVGYEELKENYSKQIKRNLNKARKANISQDSWVSVEEASLLWQRDVMPKTQVSLGQWKGLEKLLEFCHYQKRARILAVRDEFNQLVAAQIWVVWQGRSTLLLNASDDWGKDQGIPTWLIDTHIQEHAGKDHIIDFEGSSIPGLARFYSGFGSRDQPFSLHISNRLPLPIKWLKPTSST